MNLRQLVALANTKCVEGRLLRHDPQHDDPYLETDVGECDDCGGKGCIEPEELPNCVWRGAETPFAENH